VNEPVTERRQEYLTQLRRILPSSEPWEAWLERTGELPPDFETIPSHAGLLDPLSRTVDGAERPVTSAAEWAERREELKALFHRWVLGTVPPPPSRMEVRVLGEHREAGATVRRLQLAFGPESKATLRLEVIIPEGANAEPLPVFMTQQNHRPWALIAVRRGYIGVVYAGADVLDDTDTFIEAYAAHDWSRITRRAWAASRCIDYVLEHVPQADAEKIVLTGHSRNGKLSLIGAALDERVSAVISSSSGAGGSMPFHFYGEQHFGESVELLTRAFPQWFHPRLRFFSGREHKLPVDMHQLVALSAPRPCLLSIALNDAVESAWALQQTYLSVQRVYRLVGAEERLGILWRGGGHETWTSTIEDYLDWCDLQLGRAPAAAQSAPQTYARLILPTNWDAWLQSQVQTSGKTAGAGDLPETSSTQEAVEWMLGEAPPGAAGEIGRYGAEVGHVASLLGRGSAGEGLEKQQLTFGEYVAGDVFLPAGTAEAAQSSEAGPKLPAVLWLHPFSVPRGYMAGYMRGEQPVRTLARAGFATLAFDQIGHGRRIEEAERFYARHPRWSLLGKMVRDSQAALAALKGLSNVDPSQVWVVGYGLGAMVALHLAALAGPNDFTGMALVCPPPPFRTDTDEAATGSFLRWAKQHLLLPRLGLFEDRPEQIPYDVDDLLASLAPRPTLVLSPTLDWEAPLERVTEAVERARRAFAAAGADRHLEHITPEDYNRFAPHVQQRVADWLRERATGG
jgi:pimeloyl-ACP methyl ester carboxylesterase